jgi:hypothetical protein
MLYAKTVQRVTPQAARVNVRNIGVRIRTGVSRAAPIARNPVQKQIELPAM